MGPGAGFHQQLLLLKTPLFPCSFPSTALASVSDAEDGIVLRVLRKCTPADLFAAFSSPASRCLSCVLLCAKSSQIAGSRVEPRTWHRTFFQANLWLSFVTSSCSGEVADDLRPQLYRDRAPAQPAQREQAGQD
eukprot:6195207-Pleurochrysis_carterae.AAC.2